MDSIVVSGFASHCQRLCLDVCLLWCATDPWPRPILQTIWWPSAKRANSCRRRWRPRSTTSRICEHRAPLTSPLGFPVPQLIAQGCRKYFSTILWKKLCRLIVYLEFYFSYEFFILIHFHMNDEMTYSGVERASRCYYFQSNCQPLFFYVTSKYRVFNTPLPSAIFFFNFDTQRN